MSGQVNSPKGETELEQADSDELAPFAQAIEAEPGKHAGDTNEEEDMQQDEQWIMEHLRTDITPDHQEQHEKAEQSLTRLDFQKVKTSPKEEYSGDTDAPLANDLNKRFRRGIRGNPHGQPKSVEEPRGGPNGEITSLSVAIEIVEESDQH